MARQESWRNVPTSAGEIVALLERRGHHTAAADLRGRFERIVTPPRRRLSYDDLPEEIKRLIDGYVRFTNKSLRRAVRLWMADRYAAESRWGPMDSWDVSRVTDMSRLFLFPDRPDVPEEQCWTWYGFNEDIGSWDTSSVTTMMGMFYCTDFNRDISAWNTSSVTTMEMMFDTCKFNGDLGAWDVSSVTNMRSMFWNADNFTGAGIGAWDVSSVTDMWGMFTGAPVFNGDIGAWDLSSAEITSGMFSGCGVFSRDLRSWNVAPAKAYMMFERCASFDLRNLPPSLVGRLHEILVEEFNGRESDSEPESESEDEWDSDSDA